MAAWMTQQQAVRYASNEAAVTGYRFRVHKSRGVVGWWNTEATNVPVRAKRIKVREASTPQP